MSGSQLCLGNEECSIDPSIGALSYGGSRGTLKGTLQTEIGDCSIRMSDELIHR